MPLCGNLAVMTTHLAVPSQSPVGWFLGSFVVVGSGFVEWENGGRSVGFGGLRT